MHVGIWVKLEVGFFTERSQVERMRGKKWNKVKVSDIFPLHDQFISHLIRFPHQHHYGRWFESPKIE